MELEVRLLETLRARGKRKGATAQDAHRIVERAQAKAGHTMNRDKLITALKYEILQWEGVH